MRMRQRSFIIEQAGAGAGHNHSPISDVVAGRCTNKAANMTIMWKSMHQSGAGARSTV